MLFDSTCSNSHCACKENGLRLSNKSKTTFVSNRIFINTSHQGSSYNLVLITMYFLKHLVMMPLKEEQVRFDCLLHSIMKNSLQPFEKQIFHVVLRRF